MKTLNLLGVAFVVLKLCKVIDWSWVWVTMPFWGMPAIGAFWVISHYYRRANEKIAVKRKLNELIEQLKKQRVDAENKTRWVISHYYRRANEKIAVKRELNELIEQLKKQRVDAENKTR